MRGHRTARLLLASLIVLLANPPGGGSAGTPEGLLLAQAKGPVRYRQAPPLDRQQVENRIKVIKARMERKGKRLHKGGTADRLLLP